MKSIVLMVDSIGFKFFQTIISRYFINVNSSEHAYVKYVLLSWLS